MLACPGYSMPPMESASYGCHHNVMFNVVRDRPEPSFWDRARKWALNFIGEGDLVKDWELDTKIRGCISDSLVDNVDETELSRVLVATTGKQGVIPKLVAKVVVTIESRHGLGLKDRNIPGNVALVRKLAVKIMREMNVRVETIGVNCLYVEKVFFEDDSRYIVPLWRKEALKRGRLARWLVGDCSPTTLSF